jgi:hypothetical protein
MACLWEVTTVEGFVQQLAVACLPNGYRYYVSGIVREGKDPRSVDAKIVAKYDIASNKWERYRRKRAGTVNLRYVRFRRRFVILATGPWGEHPFFEGEAEIRDVESVPIRFSGYELGYRGGKVWVRIERDDLKRIRAYFLDVAVKRRMSELVGELRALPYEPYRGVRYQLLHLLQEVNQRRRSAGLPPLYPSVIRSRRTIYRPFEPARVEPRELILGASSSASSTS